MPQVMLNLVMNAIEAMSTVGERAREVITTRNVDAEHVYVTVEDSGPGVDPDAVERIFEPFYTTKASGMGMGLSVSRSIVQSHGGRLWATAKTGQAQCSTSSFRSTPKHPMREPSDTDAVIAIVDDDPSVREGLEALIRSVGWRVETFVSAQEFLGRRGAEAPSCLILDLQLPGLSGDELPRLAARDRSGHLA